MAAQQPPLLTWTVNRRGVALGLVLWALVIGAAVLTVAVFIGMQERRASGTGRRLPRALTRAEAGLADALVGWTPGLLNRRLLHPFDSLVVGRLGPGASPSGWQGVIRRLNRGLFLVSVEAEDPVSSTVATVTTLSRLGWIVRVRPVLLTISAALQAGRVTLGDDVRISGIDQSSPAVSGCLAPDSSKAGIVAATIDQLGAPSIEGSPPVLVSPVDSGFPATASATFEQLAIQATNILSGGTWSPRPSLSGGDCNISDPQNWGDPSGLAGTCSDYWPVTHVTGDLHLLPGKGQGILLVDGDLAVDGSFQFSGVVLVKGRLETGAVGGLVRVEGALLAAQAGTATLPLSGISVTYSKCMVSNSLQSSGRLIPLRSRSWKQLF